MNNFADQSARALDWPVVLAALVGHCKTEMGKEISADLPALSDLGAITEHLDQVEELLALDREGHVVELGGVVDLRPFIGRAHRGDTLAAEELRSAARTLRHLHDLAHRLHLHRELAPLLATVAGRIALDEEVVRTLEVAFEASGELSGRTYPQLAQLRQQIADLHTTIQRTLESLVAGPDLQDVLQDQFVTTRNNRYVLPIKVHAKRMDIGIVHGVSRSGETAWVEPKQVVALNNQLRVVEAQLEEEERRILSQLTRMLGRDGPAVILAIEAAVVLDLAAGRGGLARQLQATRPVVGRSGTVGLKMARHPVLLLRGVPVVGNDLSLSDDHPALVLTGPNTGGKTVALKTIGLCALLARSGCYVPAAAGSRIDVFGTVLADIGDQQDVRGDLSSFSGHLMHLKRMLDVAEPGALLLLDEICSGTDPSQGAALAQAVLERFLDQGARVVTTTHFAPLKALPHRDPRFSVAAMAYDGERPTYQLVPGATGESQAFGTALRLGIPADLLDRARSCQSVTDRAVQDSLEGLERSRFEAEAQARKARELREELEERLRAVSQREDELKNKARALEEKAAAAFVDRLKGAEKAVAAVIADLQKAPSPKKVEAARASLEALAGVLPQAPVAQGPSVAPGQVVRIVKLGQVGEVVGVNGDEVTVRSGSMSLRVKASEVEPTTTAERRAERKSRKLPPVTYTPLAPVSTAARTASNTADLRGMRFDEAEQTLDRFLAASVGRGYDVVYVLHGHGTGALKEAVRRDWLPGNGIVAKSGPADDEHGGDAYTVVKLKG